MNKFFSRRSIVTSLLAAFAAMTFGLGSPAYAGGPAQGKQQATTCKLGISVYVGWAPYYQMDADGSLAEIGKKHGVNFETVRCVDYPSSLTQYASGALDALVVTNMDALMLGVDSTVIILGDYSNGNDQVITRSGVQMKDMRGKDVVLAEATVSHYVFVKGLEAAGLKERDITIRNAAEGELAKLFINDTSIPACTTWNPFCLQIRNQAKGLTNGKGNIYDSSQLPLHVQDLLVFRTKFVQEHPEAARAAAEAWYKQLGAMRQRGPAGDKVRLAMAKEMSGAGSTLAEFDAQLETTFMYWNPADAVKTVSGKELQTANEQVVTFLGSHKLLGDGIKSDQDIGITYPDGTVRGNKDRIRLRYVTTYMDEVAKAQAAANPAPAAPATTGPEKK